MQQQPDPIFVEFIQYNNWANEQLLAICQQLTPEQAATSAPGAYGSIHRTLGHMIAAEADYIGRLTGEIPAMPFKWEDRPAIAEIAGFAEVVAESWLETIQLTPPTQMVHEEEDGNYVDYEALVIFMQVIEHGIEHRTNVTTILSSLGIELPELDIWGYATSNPVRFKWQEGSR